VRDLLEKIHQSSGAYCDPLLLHHAFSHFPNVDSFSTTSTGCPFPQCDLHLHMAWDSMVEAWDSSRSQNSFLDSMTSVKRYFAIFYAASRCFPSRIWTMVLDPIPIDLFFSPEEASKVARGDVEDYDEALKFVIRGNKPRKYEPEILFAQVRNLRISLVGFCYPLYSRVPKLGQVLGQFWVICAIYNLLIFHGRLRTPPTMNLRPGGKKASTRACGGTLRAYEAGT
jgi:hypothetical protein